MPQWEELFSYIIETSQEIGVALCVPEGLSHTFLSRNQADHRFVLVPGVRPTRAPWARRWTCDPELVVSERFQQESEAFLSSWLRVPMLSCHSATESVRWSSERFSGKLSWSR